MPKIAIDHPRGCGEKATSIYTGQDNIGSPPQVRGKGAARELGYSRIRITPAGAGKR